MPPWLAAIVVVALLISRPIEDRFWRAGRLSDRATAILLLARFPVTTLVAALFAGGPPLLTIGVVAMASVMSALFYRFTLTLLKDQRVELERQAALH